MLAIALSWSSVAAVVLGDAVELYLKYVIVRLSGSSLGLALFLYIFPASSETKQY